MNLYAKLREREAQGKPLRVGLIGAGKFGAMYLAQVPKTPGVHLVGIADLSPANARVNLERVGWSAERYSAPSLDAALKSGATHVGEDWQALVAHPGIDIIVEATGNPVAAVDHALTAFRNRKHVIMVTVEADAFCGPLLARRAQEAGVIYSLAYGDQGPYLRPGGLGRRGRLQCHSCRARAQVVAPLCAIHAGDRLGSLRIDPGASTGWWPQS